MYGRITTFTLLAPSLWAVVQAVSTVNEVADVIIGNLGAGKRMILMLAYLSGLGFLMASFYKFKQHKDNPTQVPVGNPITMMIIAILLLFLASMVQPIGETFFGAGVDSIGENLVDI